jgi:hypothetical protein
LKETGFVRKRSMPEARASDSSRELLNPVRAIMMAGVGQSEPRSLSIARMARVASNPFMTGMEISETHV